MRHLKKAERSSLTRRAAKRALPFEPLMPNAETAEAMNAARPGELVQVGSIGNLLAHLHGENPMRRRCLIPLKSPYLLR